MAFEQLSDSVDDLNTNIQSFIHSSSEYYKLKAYKQGMKGATTLVRFLIIGFLLFIALIMLSFALAIVISEAIGEPSSGYFIVAALYIIIGVVIFIFGKEPIEKLILEKSSKAIFNRKDK